MKVTKTCSCLPSLKFENDFEVMQKKLLYLFTLTGSWKTLYLQSPKEGINAIF